MDDASNFDIPALREKMLANLGENADAYPHQVERHFPRIFARLVLLWGHAEGDAYLNSLLVTDRNDRQGFPDDVARELFRLSLIHAMLQPEKMTDRDKWTRSADDSFDRRSGR